MISVAGPGFLRGWVPTLQGRAPTYDFAKFSKNCMKLTKFGPREGVQNFTMYATGYDDPINFLHEFRKCSIGFKMSTLLIIVFFLPEES